MCLWVRWESKACSVSSAECHTEAEFSYILLVVNCPSLNLPTLAGVSVAFIGLSPFKSTRYFLAKAKETLSFQTTHSFSEIFWQCWKLPSYFDLFGTTSCENIHLFIYVPISDINAERLLSHSQCDSWLSRLTYTTNPGRRKKPLPEETLVLNRIEKRQIFA